MIVGRGLGRGYRTPLVTAGFGRASVAPVLPPSGAFGGHLQRVALPRRRRNEDEEILLIISAALQVLDFQ